MNQKNGERFAVVVGSSGSIGRAISEALRLFKSLIGLR